MLLAAHVESHGYLRYIWVRSSSPDGGIMIHRLIFCDFSAGDHVCTLMDDHNELLQTAALYVGAGVAAGCKVGFF